MYVPFIKFSNKSDHFIVIKSSQKAYEEIKAFIKLSKTGCQFITHDLSLIYTFLSVQSRLF